MLEISEKVRRRIIRIDPSITKLIRNNTPMVDQREDGTPYCNGNHFVVTELGKVSTPVRPIYRLVYRVHHTQNGKKAGIRGTYQTHMIIGRERKTVEAFMDSRWI